jgi:hypothetical protein
LDEPKKVPWFVEHDGYGVIAITARKISAAALLIMWKQETINHERTRE